MKAWHSKRRQLNWLFKLRFDAANKCYDLISIAFAWVRKVGASRGRYFGRTNSGYLIITYSTVDRQNGGQFKYLAPFFIRIFRCRTHASRNSADFGIAADCVPEAGGVNANISLSFVADIHLCWQAKLKNSKNYLRITKLKKKHMQLFAHMHKSALCLFVFFLAPSWITHVHNIACMSRICMDEIMYRDNIRTTLNIETLLSLHHHRLRLRHSLASNRTYVLDIELPRSPNERCWIFDTSSENILNAFDWQYKIPSRKRIERLPPFHRYRQRVLLLCHSSIRHLTNTDPATPKMPRKNRTIFRSS